MFKEDCTTIVLLQSVYAEMNVAIMNVCIQAVCHSVWLSGSVGSLYISCSGYFGYALHQVTSWWIVGKGSDD
jgi:hypothetical protein